jgi:hypothetical protein
MGYCCNDFRSADDKGGSKAGGDLDWGAIYCRLAAGVGYTYRAIDDHTLIEVVELLEYLSEHPTAAEILAAAYGVKSKRLRKSAGAVDEADFSKNYSEVSQIMQAVPQSAPDDFKEGFAWAQAQLERMKKAN